MTRYLIDDNSELVEASPDKDLTPPIVLVDLIDGSQDVIAEAAHGISPNGVLTITRRGRNSTVAVQYGVGGWMRVQVARA